MKKNIQAIALYLFASLSLFFSGCQSEDPLITQLRKENPFAVPEEAKPIPQKKTMVTCNSINLSIPESYNIPNLEVFKSFSAKKIISARQGPVISGFGPEQIETWEKNGFLVAIAPASYWKDTINSVKRFIDEDTSASKLFIYNRIADFSELTLNIVQQPKPIDLLSFSGTQSFFPSGNGEFVFRFQSVISAPQQIETNTVNFFLISAYKQYLPLATPDNFTGEQLTGLEPLFLQGTIKNDYFIAITCDQSAIENNSMAANMLYNHQTGNISVIMLAPSAKLVADISELSLD